MAKFEAFFFASIHLSLNYKKHEFYRTSVSTFVGFLAMNGFKFHHVRFHVFSSSPQSTYKWKFPTSYQGSLLFFLPCVGFRGAREIFRFPPTRVTLCAPMEQRTKHKAPGYKARMFSKKVR